MKVFPQFVKRKIGDQIQKVCGKAKTSLSAAQIISVFFVFFLKNISLLSKIFYFLPILLLARMHPNDRL